MGQASRQTRGGPLRRHNSTMQAQWRDGGTHQGAGARREAGGGGARHETEHGDELPKMTPRLDGLVTLCSLPPRNTQHICVCVCVKRGWAVVYVRRGDRRLVLYMGVCLVGHRPHVQSSTRVCAEQRPPACYPRQSNKHVCVRTAPPVTFSTSGTGEAGQNTASVCVRGKREREWEGRQYGRSHANGAPPIPAPAPHIHRRFTLPARPHPAPLP